jgi:hypothetical protein
MLNDRRAKACWQKIGRSVFLAVYQSPKGTKLIILTF